MIKRWIRLAALCSLMAGVLLTVPSVVFATNQTPMNTPVIPIIWEETTILTWDGRTQAVGETSTQLSHVIIPGDRITQTGTIINGGPSPADTTVEIINVETRPDEGATSSCLANYLRLFWNINSKSGDNLWRDAKLGDHEISHSTGFTLDKGEDFQLTVGVYFPIESTGGQDSTCQLAYSVRITMTEHTDPSPTTQPSQSPTSPASTPPNPPTNPEKPTSKPGLNTPTGGGVLTQAWAKTLAIILVGLGLVGLYFTRRKDDSYG
ncbi:MAG: hypothetical protein LBG99_08115 [Propionibacteriaceae bacterium]|jgi:hypothetical protein|nr:hypothetical protein [Propionibacteriaceae bacterium]